MRENRGILAIGAVALVMANFLDIQLLVLLGHAMDMLGVRLGPFDDLKPTLLLFLLSSILLIILGAAISRFWMRRLIIGVSRQVEFRLRNDLFAHFQRLSPSFYSRYPTGDLMARSTNDLEAVRLVIGPAVMYFASVAVMLPMSIYAMVGISGKLTIITFLPLIMLVPLFYFFSSRIHVRFMRVQERFSDLSTRVQEIVTGIRIIKGYGREDQETERFSELSDEFVDENIRLTVLQAFFIPMMAFVVGSSLLAVVWGGGVMILREQISHGRFISFFLLMQANIWPLAAIGWVFSLVERGSASMARIDELFDAEPEIVSGAAQIEPPTGDGLAIEARDLTFTYPKAEVPALKDVSFRIAPGQTLGLTGPVGCGKSTLAVLLARRFNPGRGMLNVGGVDVLDWGLDELRRRVSIVDQEPFVFSDTIGNNIAYGLPTYDREAVERVSAISKIDGEVSDLPAGYETLLGERGINLSGGQRQRASLARALATDPELLILDDALSAVDTHTEDEILKGLRTFMEGRTTVLISHRIRTVSITDYILYLEDGRVTEQGTHDELMALGGEYWSLARTQQLEEEIEATA